MSEDRRALHLPTTCEPSTLADPEIEAVNEREGRTGRTRLQTPDEVLETLATTDLVKVPTHRRALWASHPDDRVYRALCDALGYAFHIKGGTDYFPALVAAAIRHAHEQGLAWSYRLEDLCRTYHERGGWFDFPVAELDPGIAALAEATERASAPEILRALDEFDAPEFLYTVARSVRTITPELFNRLTLTYVGTRGLAKNPSLASWPDPDDPEPLGWPERLGQAVGRHIRSSTTETSPRVREWSEHDTQEASPVTSRFAATFLAALTPLLRNVTPDLLTVTGRQWALATVLPFLRCAEWASVETFTQDVLQTWNTCIDDEATARFLAPPAASSSHVTRLLAGLADGPLLDHVIAKHLSRPDVAEALVRVTDPDARIRLADRYPGLFRARVVESLVQQTVGEMQPTEEDKLRRTYDPWLLDHQWAWLLAQPLGENQLLRLAGEEFPDRERLGSVLRHANATPAVACAALAHSGSSLRQHVRATIIERREWLTDPDVVAALRPSKSRQVILALGSVVTPQTVRDFLATYLPRFPGATIQAIEAMDDDCLRALGPLDLMPALTAKSPSMRRQAILLLARVGHEPEKEDPHDAHVATRTDGGVEPARRSV